MTLRNFRQFFSVPPRSAHSLVQIGRHPIGSVEGHLSRGGDDMNQQEQSVLAQAVDDKRIELLEGLDAAERFNAHVPEGTYFLTTSGKVSVARLRSGMTVLDGEGGHRAVVWCKYTDQAGDIAAPRKYRRLKSDLHTSSTRFPAAEPDQVLTRDPSYVEKYRVVLSQATMPVRNPIPKYDYAMAARSSAGSSDPGEFEAEPEITNIFADYDGPHPVFSHAAI